jgi:hypothetical protein
MKTFQEFMIEAGDWWHPDSKTYRTLPGKGS